MASNTGFICLLLLLSAAKAVHYVQTGTDHLFCGFQCHQQHGILKLRRNHTTVLVVECFKLVHKIHRWGDQRIIMNSSSGCLMLRDAQKNDTGSYQISFYDGSIILLLEPIGIVVLDAVKIQNITSNSSLQGSDVSLEVLFSGGNASVLWELDGSSLPPRYILKDDNRTLIIKNVDTKDARRMLTVWVKNPVSEDKREYHLLIQDERCQYCRSHEAILIILLVFVIIAVLGWKYMIVRGF
ncbi:unnamed protein product [Staurois parvus]|uniref:Uncharacterized protein n=1 Tax=Staurois parvus TaxID=386267 RepID=A0ABN9CBM2_9NEOB|nr:unnamed protein product [Staurois parvus]